MKNSFLQARHITYGYRKEHAIFTDYSIDVFPGELTAITGKSGSGKSTLLYILAGMLKPQVGEVIVDGVDIFSLKDSKRSAYRAQTSGFVFQNFALDMKRSILDNVLEPCLYAHITRNDMEKRAYELLDHLEVPRPEDTPAELSGGQAQRVALARALLLEPKIIYADEPTGNLDEESSRVVVNVLRQAARSAAVIMVTHDKRVVNLCDRTITLDPS